MKKLIMLLLVLVLAVGLIACNTEANPDDSTNEGGEGQLVLSTSELAEYDGKDGSDAYIAVDGVIYDVSDSNLWSDGEHNSFEAGQDLTEELGEHAPHDTSVLERLPVVGSLED